MRKKRLQFILFVLACIGCAAALSLYALRDNLAFFYTPHEVKAFQAANNPAVAPGHVFRVGGLVVKGSLKKLDGGMTVHFIVTDTAADIPVQYTGILPDLFREGQGVVAKGALDGNGTFVANEMLAKHDEKYMPPEVVKGLKKTHDDMKAGKL